MHLLVRDTKSLDEDSPAQELGHDPAPVLVMSFSDADLGALAAAWTPSHPAMRLVPLGKLRHPMSTDHYLEQVASHARCIVVRLLGGLDYFRYGAEELATMCRASNIPLAFLPGDAADDSRLRALSTIPPETWSALDEAFRQGGPTNTALILAWTTHLAGLGPAPAAQPNPMPQHGVHTLDLVLSSPLVSEGAGVDAGRTARVNPITERVTTEPTSNLFTKEGGEQPFPPLAAIVFYRSHLLSQDIAPIEALAAALRVRGFAVGTLYAASLKAPATAAWVAATLAAWRPAVVLNATAFSARPNSVQEGAGPSPLDAPGTPVLQLVLSGSRRVAWEASSRGLSPTDLAMHVVLPELDGRLLTGAISFKGEAAANPAIQYARTLHEPDAPGIALAAGRAAGWARLAAAPPDQRRLAVILSDYPGIGGQQGHAIGLDTFASTNAILGQLPGTVPIDPAALCTAPPTPFMTLADYTRLRATLPDALNAVLDAAWGGPATDPSVVEDSFTVRHIRTGQAIVALQPDRGAAADRRTTYHDPDQPPRHAYVAFHLWLRHTLDIHAIVQVGAHGSLEWLPGKAAALSPLCWPQALLGGLPVIYPFIVNNPGEAAPAKRRLGAVTLGHATPPMARTAHHGAAATLERLLDEYAAADGLDRRRAARLRDTILDHAAAAGLLQESGAPPDPEQALSRLDAYLCDVKDLQVRQGLHVYGTAGDETAHLRAAIEGRHVPPGPAGAPSRGRMDIHPTGRNLTTIDPRAVPTRTAIDLAEKAAAALLRRHLTEHGEYPRNVVLDLWASATMRTGGEDLALAFHLLGARPLWDDGSARVSGFEVLPIALLDRPRIDVTLRISGLFRDAFAHQVALFDSLVQTIAGRDESSDWNPLAGAPGARVFGPAPGQYGAGDATAAGWFAASRTVYTGDTATDSPETLRQRLAAADAFIHTQDHAEHDLLDSPDWAAHEGGFHQAAAAAGASPALYHLDTSTPETPKPRLVAEEVARIVRARAANPAWIAGMMRHGRAGAAELARPLAALEAYASSLPTRFDAQFDLLHDALTDPEVDSFLRTHNPEAHQDLQKRFARIHQAGLWHPRRNAA